MSWFEKLIPASIRTDGKSKGSIPQGLWSKCQACDSVLYRAELERSQEVCPKCGFHQRLTGRARLEHYLDAEGREEIGTKLRTIDPLKFKDSKKYKDRYASAVKETGEAEALVAMRGKVDGFELVAVAFNFNFLGGSMGSVVGERFKRAVDCCLEHKIPLICFSASGGARMQESLLSLFQMAKTSAALAKMSEQKLPFISVMTDPTMGGVSASLAMLGDINIAEPNALVGFAGPRVIEQTVSEKLPEGFQRSEFLLEHGAIDMIVDRRDMRETTVNLLTMLMGQAAQSEDTPTDETEPVTDDAPESPEASESESEVPIVKPANI